MRALNPYINENPCCINMLEIRLQKVFDPESLKPKHTAVAEFRPLITWKGIPLLLRIIYRVNRPHSNSVPRLDPKKKTQFPVFSNTDK